MVRPRVSLRVTVFPCCLIWDQAARASCWLAVLGLPCFSSLGDSRCDIVFGVTRSKPFGPVDVRTVPGLRCHATI